MIFFPPLSVLLYEVEVFCVVSAQIPGTYFTFPCGISVSNPYSSVLQRNKYLFFLFPLIGVTSVGITHEQEKGSPGFFWSWESGPEISRKGTRRGSQLSRGSITPGGPGKYHFLYLELHWRVLTSSHVQKLRQESFISLKFDESLVR